MEFRKGGDEIRDLGMNVNPRIREEELEAYNLEHLENEVEVSGRRIHALCPNIHVEGDRFKPTNGAEKDEIPGFDLMEYFNVKELFGMKEIGSPSSYVRLGTIPIVQQTEDVFPQGLPDEYAFVTTFKFRKTSRREDWYIWQIIDKYGIPQVSVRLDGENRAVEYNAIGVTRDAVRAVFRNPEVADLFDRNWHKIALSIQAQTVSLYLDCKLIQTMPIEEREDIDIQGKTVIGKRLYDSVPIDFDLQRMVIYCDSRHAELETCCDIPTGPCKVTVVTEPPFIIPTTPQSGEQHGGIKTVNCSCQAGEKGSASSVKGDKGEKIQGKLEILDFQDHLDPREKEGIKVKEEMMEKRMSAVIALLVLQDCQVYQVLKVTKGQKALQERMDETDIKYEHKPVPL
ncbi:COMA1 protein, partial [Polypterus senegalus]